MVDTSDALPVLLKAAAAYTPFTPSSPGILVTLPAWPLHTGETFTMSLVAANPLFQPLSGWSVPLRYNPLALDLVAPTVDALWGNPTTSGATIIGGGSMKEITIVVTAPSAGQPVERYRTSGSIPLAQISFMVRALQGAYDNAIALGPSAMLAPSWLAPRSVAFYDYRGGSQTSGSVMVEATQQLGIWAWADRGEVFNTARFTGQAVVTQLQAAYVRSWGTPAAQPAPPSTCSPASAGGSPSAGPSAMSLDERACVVRVEAPNAAAAKDLEFAVGLGSLSTSVVFSIWQPSNVAVVAEDPVLNSVMPLNAAPLPAGCSDRYQATRLKATADWSNGGAAAGDTIRQADVTALAAFVSNSSGVAFVLGATLRGMSTGAASVGIARLTPPAAPAAITVSDTPACLLSLAPLATTGIQLVRSSLAPLPDTTTTLGWRAAQDLVWEDSVAQIVTVAQFDDGSHNDISGRALLTAGMPDGAAGPMPFQLSTDASGKPLVAVNISASGSAAIRRCGPYLTATWEVCGRQLGSGSGQVLLSMPMPQAISGFVADPGVITSGDDPAALPPLSLAQAAALSLNVTFSDGSTRDFTTDSRVTVTVTAGTSLCTVARANATTGAWVVRVAAGSTGSMGAGCTLAAAVRFDGSAPPLNATVAIGVVTLRSVLLYGLQPSASEPPALPPPIAPLGSTLRLLRCDRRNFDQVTLWGMAVLSNCSAPAGTCPMTDITNRQWATLNSSSSSIISVMGGYPSDPGVLS